MGAGSLPGLAPRGLVRAKRPGNEYLNASGPDGAWFGVESSTDLLNWSSAGTNQVFQGSLDFVDMDAASNTARFYRPVPQLTPPTQ